MIEQSFYPRLAVEMKLLVHQGTSTVKDYSFSHILTKWYRWCYTIHGEGGRTLWGKEWWKGLILKKHKIQLTNPDHQETVKRNEKMMTMLMMVKGMFYLNDHSKCGLCEYSL